MNDCSAAVIQESMAIGSSRPSPDVRALPRKRPFTVPWQTAILRRHLQYHCNKDILPIHSRFAPTRFFLSF